MRVLIAFEEPHYIYSEAVKEILRRHRPHIAVMNVPLKALRDHLKGFVPHLVVSSESNTVDPGGTAAWIKISPEPAELSTFCLDGQSSEVSNPRLAELLTVVDEAEELVQKGADPTGC
jgi:hypothetical protein